MRAADLRRHAEGQPVAVRVVVGDEDRLDGAAVVRPPAQLARAVAGRLDDVRGQRPQRVRLGERLSQRRWHVDHLVDGLDRLAMQPAEDLLGPVGGRARSGRPGRQLRREQPPQGRADARMGKVAVGWEGCGGHGRGG